MMRKAFPIAALLALVPSVQAQVVADAAGQQESQDRRRHCNLALSDASAHCTAGVECHPPIG